MTIEVPELPYASNALEPHVSSTTLDFQHGKHHKSYVDKLTAAIEGTAYEGQSLEKIIADAKWEFAAQNYPADRAAT